MILLDANMLSELMRRARRIRRRPVGRSLHGASGTMHHSRQPCLRGGRAAHLLR